MMTMMSCCHSPSQLQGRDEEAEDDQVERPELEEDDYEVDVDMLNVLDVVGEDDVVSV